MGGRAMKSLKVAPASCVVWRDGVGDPTIAQVAQQEIPSIRDNLIPGGTVGTKKKTGGKSSIPFTYIVCQKRIGIKFLSDDGQLGMPAGSKVDALQGPAYSTFYIN